MSAVSRRGLKASPEVFGETAVQELRVVKVLKYTAVS
jgi:hypothetical protein